MAKPRRTGMLAHFDPRRAILALPGTLLLALLALGAALAGVALGVGAPALAQPAASFPTTDTRPASKIDPALIAATANGQSASVVIMLADQSDLSAAYTMTDQDARGWYVYRTLT